MSKKNTYNLKIVILFCATVAPSFYILSIPSYKRGPKEPSNRTRQTYVAPALAQESPTTNSVIKPDTSSFANASDTPKAYTDTTTVPATNKTADIATLITEQKKEKENQEESPIATVSQSKKIQVPQPGWLMTAYTTIMPIILVTLDNAIGTGIAASTKSAIKLFGTRSEFLNLKSEAQKEAKKMLEKGIFEKSILAQTEKDLLTDNISKDDPRYAQAIKQQIDYARTIPQEEKINLLTKDILSLSKIDHDQMEKATSVSSILSNSVTTGILNTIIPMIGKFIGYGVTLSLQALMPAQQQ